MDSCSVGGKSDEICWFCKKGRHSECMKEIPIDARSEGPHDCTFDTKMIPCKCVHWNIKYGILWDHTLNHDAEYWSQYSENSDSNYNEEMAKFIRDLAISLRVQNVLEVGCNSGNDLKLFPQEFDVSGIDPSESAIRKASQNLHYFKFKIGLITELPFEDSSFDFVFTRNVLNHIDDPSMEKSVSELFRVSRKYILNVEYFSDDENQIQEAPIPTWNRNMYKRWLNFKVKIISNVEMHEEIDPKKSKFTLIRKI